MNITRQDLKRIRDIERSIEALQIVLDDIRASSYQSPAFEDRGTSGTINTSSKTEQLALKADDVIRMLEQKQEELKEQKLKVSVYIAELSSEDPVLSAALTYKFIKGYSWNKTAQIMHTTEASLKMMYSRKIPKM